MAIIDWPLTIMAAASASTPAASSTSAAPSSAGRSTGHPAAGRSTGHPAAAAAAAGQASHPSSPQSGPPRKHRAVARHVDERNEEARADGEPPETRERRTHLHVLDHGVADKRPRVATRPDDARDAADGRRLHERHETVGAALGGLNGDTPEDEDGEGAPRAVGLVGPVGEDEHQDPLHDRLQEQRPDTPAHRPPLVGVIGHPPAEGAREKVGQAEAPADKRALLLRHGKRLREVQRDLPVDHQLQPEAEHVHHEQDPHAPVGRRDLEGASSDGRGLGSGVAAAIVRLVRRLLGLALLQLRVVAIGAVVREEVDGEASEEDDAGGPRERRAPRGVVVVARRLEPAEAERDHNQRRAAPEVAPPGGGGVGEADDVGVEHERRPELGEHEGAADEADERAHDEELPEVLDEHREEPRDAEHDEHARVREPHAEPVSDGAADDTDDDGEGDRHDGGGGRVRRGDADAAAAHADAVVEGRADLAALVLRHGVAEDIREVGEARRADVAGGVLALGFPQRRHEGGDVEPHEEANEERERREPESAHVRALERA
eukprot:CAMPEP_0180195638 /NCGR_PEP_ID=MMETSP0987-20121128/3685_1 /TAXON_ID=697907 /ORGANISM="non described non described, Strain CCMP2293" /LENGTH=547 /DNA_ID=CAMNT_0022150475 /DNA_START=158 /DNA_END=1803 /DNA_ORIENTATION=+